MSEQPEERPLAWNAIQPGTPVLASDGVEMGSVVEVAGSPEDDIYHGIVFRSGTLAPAQLAPAADIGEVTERAVHLKVAAATARLYGPPG